MSRYICKVGKEYLSRDMLNSIALVPDLRKATAFDNVRDAFDLCKQWGLPIARVVPVVPRRSPFLPGDLVVITQPPGSAKEFYGGEGRLVSRYSAGGGWYVDMIHPYEGARYVFSETCLRRVV